MASNTTSKDELIAELLEAIEKAGDRPGAVPRNEIEEAALRAHKETSNA